MTRPQVPHPRSRLPAATPLAALALGLLVSGAVDRAVRVRSEPRSQSHSAAAAPIAPLSPLRFRLVDLGGVGISADTAAWGPDYSHNSAAFHRLILDRPPYVDEREARRIAADWSDYVHRMAAQGNNGLVVPLFLELVAFDSLPAIYQSGALAVKHRVVRARFRELFAIARGAGLDVYLATDMAPLTPPLRRYFERHGGLSPANPEVWSVYRRAFEEALDAMPEVRGVVVRIGEAGALTTAPAGRTGVSSSSARLPGSA
ncbi:MAG TPA: hypothetical protein VFU46_03190 [Gemmatimonadales bacterium]|nr:hypothetical protein [Gemmatimonadales bacterium]